MSLSGRPKATTGNDRVGILVMAAGSGSRFGGVKQLAPLAGRPLLDHVLATASAAGLERTILMLGANSDAILAGVELRAAEPLHCCAWQEGMSAPLAGGIAALSDLDAIVVLLGDQPLIGPEAVARLLTARRADKNAVRATYSGRPGHPVVIEASLFDAVLAVQGDQGGRSIFDPETTLDVPCADIADPIDVDRPADLDTVQRILEEKERR